MLRKTLFLFLTALVFLSSSAWADKSNNDPDSKLEPVTLQLRWHHQFQFAGYYAAIEKGYYREAGLKVNLVEGGASINTIDEVLEGGADYGVTNSEILLHRLKGRPLVVLAAVFQHSPLILITRRENGISSPQDLVGKSVLVSRSSRDIEIQAMLRKEGISLDKLNLIEKGAAYDDYFDTKIDALTAYSTNQTYFLLQKGVLYNTIRPITYGIDFYGDCIFTSENELKENPDRVKAFLKASLKGWMYAMDNPDEIIRLIKDKYNSTKTIEHLKFEADAMQPLILPQLVDIGHMNPGRWKHIANTFAQFGLIDPNYDMSGFLYKPESNKMTTSLKRYLGVSLVGFFIVLFFLVVTWIFYHRLTIEVMERRQTEEALRESEERFLTAFRSNPGAISLSDAEDKILIEINEGFTEIFGYEPQEVLGKTSLELGIWTEGEAVYEIRNDQLKKHGVVRNFEFTFTRKNGAIGTGLNSSAIVGIDGQAHVISMSLDITDRKLAEEKLSKKARELATLNGLAQAVNSSLSVDHVVQVALEQASSLIEYDLALLFFLNEQELNLVKLYKKDEDFQYEIPRQHMVGECLCGRAVSIGKTIFSKNIHTDPLCTMDECKAAGIVSCVAIPLIGGGKTIGIINFASKEERDFSEFSDFLEAFSNEMTVGLQNALMYEQVEKKSNQLEQKLMELRSAQAELLEEKERFRVLVEESPFGVSIIDRNGKYQYVNHKFTEITGYHLADVPMGRDWFLKAFPDEKERTEAKNAWKAELVAFSGGQVRTRVYDITCKDGSVKTINFIPVTIQSGVQFIIYEDITEKVRTSAELKRVESQLLQAQKMEAIGNLAGGIAHDFNNILSIIISNSDLAESKLEPVSAISNHISQIKKASYRAADLVRQILTFSRQNQPEVQPLEVEKITREAITFMRATLPSTIEITLETTRDLPLILADQTQIHQVLMNLCANAAHAMQPKGGKICIKLSNSENGLEKFPKPSDLAPGKYVVITVSDTGMGMDQHTVSRIFEPFFSTKSREEGTGLGLAVVHGIIKSHKGAITVYSKPGSGSSFHVFLPVAEAKPSDEEMEDPIWETDQNEHIMLIDDEDSLVTAGKEILEFLGFRVTSFRSSQDALDYFLANPARIDLIITDQTMPGLTGLDLSREILKTRPDIPIILCTGYSRQVSRKTVEQIGIRSVCPKPYTVQELSMAIKRVLNPEA